MDIEHKFSELSEFGSFALRQEGGWNGSSDLKKCVNELRVNESICCADVDDKGNVAWGND
jgi:hypothetical protein